MANWGVTASGASRIISTPSLRFKVGNPTPSLQLLCNKVVIVNCDEGISDDCLKKITKSIKTILKKKEKIGTWEKKIHHFSVNGKNICSLYFYYIEIDTDNLDITQRLLNNADNISDIVENSFKNIRFQKRTLIRAYAKEKTVVLEDFVLTYKNALQLPIEIDPGDMVLSAYAAVEASEFVTKNGITIVQGGKLWIIKFVLR